MNVFATERNGSLKKALRFVENCSHLEAAVESYEKSMLYIYSIALLYLHCGIYLLENYNNSGQITMTINMDIYHIAEYYLVELYIN